MINLFIGNLGHLFVIISFVLSLASAFSYFKAVKTIENPSQKDWLQNGRVLFYLQSAFVVGVIFILFLIIYLHRFEYHYAYAHSSRFLPVYYMISCFWEGQEGSFLLWIFWNSILGIILIRTNRNKKWEAPVMVTFAVVQAFLTSMILGVDILGAKIGSSPFVLLRNAIADPIFAINPDFIPQDGSGLNPLLQNYWMVIHPPTLFLGYASTLIPFAYVLAGLWMKDYKNWIKPALPWAIMSAALMAIGQLMGAYWAYETLSFGGYWSWDPVENAVYVPWIVQVASIHTMIIFKKNNSALKTSIILVITTFILILYATFLTRSGILGSASVHSFTDLGLSGQLLIYLLVFLFAAIALSVFRWKEIPSSEGEVSTYSREFWIFMGATVMCLMGFQVIAATSIPVYTAILGIFGINSGMAPPADQALFYSKFQIWGGILLAVFSGTGQFFYWKNIDKSRIWNELAIPVLLSLVASTIVFIAAGVNKLPYILLLTAGIYSIISNGTIFIKLLKKQSLKLAGGAIAHIGIAMMLIGILFSAGYSRIISLNTTGKIYSEEMSDDMNRENVLLFANEPKLMNDYELTYKGQRIELVGVPGFPPKGYVAKTEDQHIVVALKDYSYGEKVIFKSGDTLEIKPENTYYEVEYAKNGEKKFSLFPRAQVNPNMGLLVSPDIKRQIGKDLYTHIASIPNPEEKVEWGTPKTETVSVGQNFFVNDQVATVTKIQQLSEVAGLVLGGEDIAAEAIIEIQGKTGIFTLRPVFIIKEKMMGNIPDANEDFGVRISFVNIFPQESKFELAVETAPKDYIIMKAIEMPMINVLWLGTLVLMLGFSVATYKRYKEFRREGQAKD